jgi:hypothetical protein
MKGQNAAFQMKEQYVPARRDKWPLSAGSKPSGAAELFYAFSCATTSMPKRLKPMIRPMTLVTRYQPANPTAHNAIPIGT